MMNLGFWDLALHASYINCRRTRRIGFPAVNRQVWSEAEASVRPVLGSTEGAMPLHWQHWLSNMVQPGSLQKTKYRSWIGVLENSWKVGCSLHFTFTNLKLSRCDPFFLGFVGARLFLADLWRCDVGEVFWLQTNGCRPRVREAWWSKSADCLLCHLASLVQWNNCQCWVTAVEQFSKTCSTKLTIAKTSHIFVTLLFCWSISFFFKVSVYIYLFVSFFLSFPFLPFALSLSFLSFFLSFLFFSIFFALYAIYFSFLGLSFPEWPISSKAGIFDFGETDPETDLRNRPVIFVDQSWVLTKEPKETKPANQMEQRGEPTKIPWLRGTRNRLKTDLNQTRRRPYW